MGYKDVRQWIQKVDEMGELKIVENADWHSETLSVLFFKHRENTLASMFDHIRDSLAGYRIPVRCFARTTKAECQQNLQRSGRKNWSLRVRIF